MLYTIKDLKEGRVAICGSKNKTGELFHKVMKLAFPNSSIPEGRQSYYQKGRSTEKWDCSNTTKLPIQSAKDFLRSSIKDNYKIY